MERSIVFLSKKCSPMRRYKNLWSLLLYSFQVQCEVYLSFVSHRRTVLSLLPLTSVCPLGENERKSIHEVCPLSVALRCPISVFHNTNGVIPTCTRK